MTEVRTIASDAQKDERVKCFRRNAEGLWILQSYTDRHSTFHLESIDFEETIDAPYEGVGFEDAKTGRVGFYFVAAYC